MQFTPKENEQLISEIQALLTTHEPVMFEHKLSVKTTPHNELCRLYGVIKNNRNDVWVYDGGSWYDLQPNQLNVGYVLQSLKQRLISVLPDVVVVDAN